MGYPRIRRHAGKAPGPRILLVWAATIVLGCVLVLWALPALLTRHPSTGLSAAEQLKATNDARATLVAFVLAVGAAGTLPVHRPNLSAQSPGQITERYTRAIGQIGDASPEVHLGGIYGLERIGRDSPEDRPTVVYVLGAFVRNRSRDGRDPDRQPPEDVYAALRVISRLAAATDVVVNLQGANLRNATLTFMSDVDVHLDDADLTGAHLPAQWTADESTTHLTPPSAPV